MEAVIRLIENWKKAHRLWSVRCSLAGVFFTSVGIAASYAGSALAWLPVLSYRQVLLVALVIFVSVLIGRLLQQAGKTPDDTDQAGA